FSRLKTDSMITRAVARKEDLADQLAHIENDIEDLAGRLQSNAADIQQALAACADPYHAVVAGSIEALTDRLTEMLAPHYRTEEKAAAIVAGCDQLTYWRSHGCCTWSDKNDLGTARFVLALLDAYAKKGTPPWPPPAPMRATPAATADEEDR